MKAFPTVTAALVVASFSLLATRGAASDAASPTFEQARITAEYGARWAHLPSWVPPGFRLHSWAIDGGSFGFLADRLRLRFRNGTSDLLWEVASGHRAEKADRSTCERSRRSRRINGRNVYDVGHDAAYVCISVKGPWGRSLLGVSVREVTPSPDVGIAQLRKMVSGATALPSRSNVRASALVPRAEAKALRAAFGGSVPLPSTMAPGFIFTRSFVQDRSAYFPRTAYVRFGQGMIASARE